jgi:hypothetical protein
LVYKAALRTDRCSLDPSERRSPSDATPLEQLYVLS